MSKSNRQVDYDAVEQMLRQGKTLVQAASEVGCSYGTVVTISRIKGNLASRIRAEKTAVLLDEAARLYRDEAYSIAAIAKKLGLHSVKIRIGLHHRGIPIRARGERPIHPLRARAISVLQDAGFKDTEISAILGISRERVGQIGDKRLAAHEMP